METICETIAHNARNIVSRNPHKRPQENQQERGISNQVGNPSNEIYRGIIQAWIPQDKNNDGQGEGELITHLRCPRI